MSTALAKIGDADAETEAVISLTGCCENALRVSKASSGEWMLAHTAELTSAQLRNGIAAYKEAIAGGPVDRISRALMAMIAVTRKPSGMDDDKTKLYFKVIQSAMLDYPVDLVEQALQDWRKGESGEWWPAEAELRRVCERLFEPRRALYVKARMLLDDLEREEELRERAKRPSAFAGDQSRAFREAMRERFTPQRFAAYFHAAAIIYQGNEILVRWRASETVLNAEGGVLLASLGLRLRYAPEAFAGVPEPNWPADTPEERTETAAKMRKLMEAVRTGADIKAMRRAGAL